jgi:hypothetical protein
MVFPPPLTPEGGRGLDLDLADAVLRLAFALMITKFGFDDEIPELASPEGIDEVAKFSQPPFGLFSSFLYSPPNSWKNEAFPADPQSLMCVQHQSVSGCK